MSLKHVFKINWVTRINKTYCFRKSIVQTQTAIAYQIYNRNQAKQQLATLDICSDGVMYLFRHIVHGQRTAIEYTF